VFCLPALQYFVPTSKIFLSQLPEDDRQHLKHCLKVLLSWLRRSETRLQSYQGINAVAESQCVLKLITDLKETLVMTEGTINELLARHELPDELGHIDDEYRRLLRDVLVGNLPKKGGEPGK
jgi:hypothetical protein